MAYTQGDPEFRAMWVSRFEWPNSNRTTCQNKINEIMTNLADHNFNAVVFQIRGQMDTLYPSPHEPWSALLGSLGSDPGWDPVQYAIDAAHSRGLEFHAYINYSVCWQSSTNSPPAHTTPEHPFWLHCNTSGTSDWLLANSSGTQVVYGSDGYVWVANGVPSFMEWIRKVTMHVVNTYDVDGIHYDRIRFPANTYSYDTISNARRAGPGNPHSLGFKDWQRDQITRSLTDIYGSIMKVKPWIKVSNAPFGIYDRSRFAGYSGYTDAYDIWLQESQHWSEVGCMDAVIPMIYWDIATAPRYDILIQDWVDHNYGRHIYGGMSASKYTFPELGNEMLENRNRGAQGHCPFSYGSISASEFDTFLSTYFQTKVDTPSMPWKDNPTTGIIQGIVRDGATMQPVTDAWVTRSGSTYVTLSSYDGLYTILNLPPGTYTLNAIKTGIGTAQATGVVVTAGQVTTVDLTLSLDTPTSTPSQTPTPTGPTVTPSHTPTETPTQPTSTPTDTPTVTPTGMVSEYIIDDGDPGYAKNNTADWTYVSGGGSEPYNSDYDWAYSNTGAETSWATWTPNLLASGYYDVYVRYRQGSNRSNNVPYTVYSLDGTQTFAVNQRVGGGTWVVLGNIAL